LLESFALQKTWALSPKVTAAGEAGVLSAWLIFRPAGQLTPSLEALE
jgi:hypothetical protein